MAFLGNRSSEPEAVSPAFKPNHAMTWALPGGRSYFEKGQVVTTSATASLDKRRSLQTAML